jgi:hypothetical protein
MQFCPLWFKKNPKSTLRLKHWRYVASRATGQTMPVNPPKEASI